MTRRILLVLIALLPTAAVAQPVPRLTLAAFRQLPLTDAEFRTIENNVAPYIR